MGQCVFFFIIIHLFINSDNNSFIKKKNEINQVDRTEERESGFHLSVSRKTEPSWLLCPVPIKAYKTVKQSGLKSNTFDQRNCGKQHAQQAPSAGKPTCEQVTFSLGFTLIGLGREETFLKIKHRTCVILFSGFSIPVEDRGSGFPHRTEPEGSQDRRLRGWEPDYQKRAGVWCHCDI